MLKFWKNLPILLMESDLPESLRQMTPDYPVNIIDIRRFFNTEVFQTDVRQVFQFIQCSNDEEALWKLVNEDVYYQEMDEDAFAIVAKYTNAKQLIEVKDYEGKDGKKNMCKAIADLMESSRKEGREEGREEGRVTKQYIIIRNLLNENESVERICRIVECDEDAVENVRQAMILDRE